MKRIVLAAVILIGLGAGIVRMPTTHAQDFFGNGWTAQYFDNTTLSGTPVLTRQETRIALQFGTGSPGVEVPADRFSAVFTTTENFQQSTDYEFVARADDGVRVIVGGAVVIDQFNGPPGTYSGRIRISGSQEIRVEYKEEVDNAFIEVFWRIAPPPTPPPIPPGAVAATVVRASVLIVRDGPSLGANRVGTIRRGEVYVVVGRDPDARWFLLDLGDRQAWAWGFYLFIDGNEFKPPVVGPFAVSDGITDVPLVVRSISGLKLRAEPNTQSAQIGRIEWGATMPVVGRSERGSWYLVIWKGTEGWVFSPFTEPVQGSLNDVPFVPGSGDLIRIGPAAEPSYDISVDGADAITAPTPAAETSEGGVTPVPTPSGPTPIPEATPIPGLGGAGS